MSVPRWLHIALIRLVLWPTVWFAIAWYRCWGMSRDEARLEVSSWLTTALAIERGKRGLLPQRPRPPGG
jgi:hypothetical protein